jgi:hypothetical protein
MAQPDINEGRRFVVRQISTGNFKIISKHAHWFSLPKRPLPLMLQLRVI